MASRETGPSDEEHGPSPHLRVCIPGAVPCWPQKPISHREGAWRRAANNPVTPAPYALRTSRQRT